MSRCPNCGAYCRSSSVSIGIRAGFVDKEGESEGLAEENRIYIHQFYCYKCDSEWNAELEEECDEIKDEFQRED